MPSSFIHRLRRFCVVCGWVYLGKRIVSQRRLITEHRSWPNYRGAADMTTTTSDRAVQLCCCSDSCVRPDNAVLDTRAFFDKASLAQHRVDDLCAGFDHAVVADHRKLVDLRYCRRIKLTASLLDVNPPDTTSEQICVNLQVSFGRADVDPVG